MNESSSLFSPNTIDFHRVEVTMTPAETTVVSHSTSSTQSYET